MSKENGESGAGTSKVEMVQPRDIMRELGAKSGSEKASGKELDPLQKVGLWLAIVFFGYILLASAAIFLVSFRYLQIPALPSPPQNSGDIEQYKRLIDLYKQSADSYQQLAKIQVDRATQLFQLVVASTILPVFSAILGYIFGSKKAGD